LSGGGVLGRSVLFGTSSARCVDGALRLIHLFVGGLRT
jgi:hypothetical protein